jgi:hypothetical protein
MSYIVSAVKPPIASGGVAYWERSTDPFHFSAIEAALQPAKHTVALLIGGTIDQLDQAREGWLAIDWIENPVGFVPDGYEQQGEEHVFIIQPGPYKHLCAYQIDWYGEELIQQHQKMIASK